ncbi:hypothetical protein [Glaciimonas soli]|uniref:Uncharacterized protein n=1 Tax=Glaciimonas soli TaxID=2590999 RepID=A0A843YMM8_9BURK|nr:hypothetical protein [Glaciimonas soli]MQR00715.1 hypothetical protein [Glaciimonas soli]
MPYSIDSKLGELLDNEATKAILEKYMPDINEHPQLSMGRGFPLMAVIKFVGLAIPKGQLEIIDAELRTLG